MENVKANSLEDLTKEGIVIVDFYAEWCGPCKVVKTVLEKVESEMPDVKFYKVNIDEDTDYTTKKGIRSIPTIHYFKNGELIDISKGASTEDFYKEKINNLKNG